VPDGAWAANLLGLSTQVPAKITYRTDGPNHEVPIGRSIHFKHARPKAIAGLEGKFALLVQALRYLGKEGVGAREIETLRASLSPTGETKTHEGYAVRCGLDLRRGEEDRGEDRMNKIVQRLSELDVAYRGSPLVEGAGETILR